MIESYPLCWPLSFPRTKFPEKSALRTSFTKARNNLINELKLMRAEGIIISSNIPLRKDGYPYANFGNLKDQGIAVYFTLKNKQMVFACDRWDKIESNLQALNKTIEAIRGIKRWGSTDLLEKAFSGFTQIEAPSIKKEWYEILEVHKDCRDYGLVKEKRNFLAKKYHEDGSEPNHQKMVEINQAFGFFFALINRT